MTLKITGLVTEPVEIAETPFGRLFVSRWNFGAIQKAMKAELSGVSGADFVRGFFATLARRVSADASLTSEAFDAGERVPESELASISEMELERLAAAYLGGDGGTFVHEEEGSEPPDGETATGRLERIAKRNIESMEESARRFVERFGKFNLGAGLSESFLRTANLADGLERLIPRGLLGDGRSVTMGDALNSATKVGTAVVRPVDPLEHLRDITLPPNPIHETNDLLGDVSDNIGRMVAISEQQAALIQSLSETASLALAQAASSSAQAEISAQLAERSTRLTKYGVLVAILAIGVSVAVSGYAISDARRLADETDRRLVEVIGAVKGGTEAIDGVRDRLDASSREAIEAQVATGKAIADAIRQLRPADAPEPAVQKTP